MELILVLDTNAYSDWRRSGRWHDRIAVANRVILPAIVIGELHHGFRNGTRFDENARRLRAFLAEPQVAVHATTLRTAEIYGEFTDFLQRQGTPIPTNDIWIASAVHECGGRLLSRDDHFRLIPFIDLDTA
ncbi:MAG: type II toxin-antitoxin system VapC family toxin [Verrucomicrobiales bacterium]